METLRSAEPCYEEDGSLCAWVYDRSGGNADLANAVDWFVDKPLQVILILVVAWVLTRLARRWVSRVVRKVVAPERSSLHRLQDLGVDLPDTLAPQEDDPRREGRAHSISAVLTSFTITVIWSIAGLLILGAMGVQIGPLLAGAGIAGVALGFGAQSLVKDCIAGLFMLIEDQYGIGDFVDLGEASGIVEGFSLRTTVLRSIDGTVWHVPNGVAQRVGNHSQIWSVAVVDVDVAYDTDLDRAREIFERAAVDVCELPEFRDAVLEPPRVLGVEALAADGISIRLIVKVAPGEQWELQRVLRERVKRAFDESSIEIPFPQRTVWMRVDHDAPAAGRPEPRPG